MPRYTEASHTASNPPLVAAAAHVGQAALLLRRALRDTLSGRTAASLQRIADACQFICGAIERMTHTEARQ